jgi:TP901 family phage tail tape measure protein
MADIESNIRFGVDTSDAIASIKMLQAQISAFQRQMASSSAANADSARKLRRGLMDDLNATGQWSASIKTIKSSSESFTTALEKNKLSMGEYFRYAGGATQKFGKLFTTEFNTIEKVARERVKDLQTQYISLGRDANGALKAIAVRPLKLDMNDLATQTAMNAQKQQIFNQLLRQGSTNLLNFGKNTQWAGRQLMVGFTIPLSIFGSMASKTFMDLEQQAIRFRRVYGELFTPPGEADEMLETLKELGKEFTKYGVAVEKTLGLAADAAAMGKTGAELLDQVTEANRLAVLGNVEQQQALETTISITNAFAVATEDLAKKIDFLNAVENQTVVSIEDMTIAVPKAGPVVKQLGGDVEDLAFFLTAMKEGGINASEGANALKSGLASLINPTGVASTMLKTFGINLQELNMANKGDVKGLVIDFAKALDELDPLQRAQAIEQLFGKFQFSRLSTLFQNVIQEGNQASRVLELANATTQELAALSSKELRAVEESTTFRFKKAIEEFKVAIAPIGEEFLKLITPIIEFANGIIEKFNGLSDGAKSFITGLTVLLGAVGPVALMTFGLLANGVANILKGFAFVRQVFQRAGNQSTILGEQIDYMTQEQLTAASVAASLDQTHQKLIQTFSVEAGAVKNLADVYRQAFNEQQRFDTGRNIARQAGLRLASGIVSVPGPKGAGDIVPAMLSPGEAVIPADAAKKYAPLVQGMISGNIPGFSKGVFLGMPRSGKSTGKNRDAAEEIYQMFLQSSYKNVPPTNYGHQLSPTSGHSFPIFGLGGVYMGPDGQKVFVKPVMDEKAALAEMRGTQIARQAHGLKSPEQRIVVIRDPQDVSGTRRFLALESKLDSTFVNNDPMAVFNEEQYFKQLVASLLRVDKDLAAGNLFGNVLADVGPAGVFNRASGVRDYDQNLPSMEDQAMINLLGIKGGAKRAFAESTLGLMAGLTAEQYHQKMISEIQQVLPLLKQTVASFGLTDPAEVDVYNNMIRRLEQGLTTDWSKFHAIHSAVKPAKPRQTGNAVPGYAEGVVSVPGPKGAGDVMPAMLSPGEAVIPADKAKKYAGFIQQMIYGKIPGFENSNVKRQTQRVEMFKQEGELSMQASHYDFAAPGILADTLTELTDELGDFTVRVYQISEKLEDGSRNLEVVEEKLADLAGRDIDMAASGRVYGATTKLETKDRNQAYRVAGIEGTPFSLEGVVAAGEKAEAALLLTTKEALKYRAEFEAIVQEAKIASQLLSSDNSSQERLSFMVNNAKESLVQAYRSGTSTAGKVKNIEEARALASAKLAEITDKYRLLVEGGMDEVLALQAAERELKAEMLMASGVYSAGPSGTSGNILRDVNTSRASFNPDSSRGRLNSLTPEGVPKLPSAGLDTAVVATAFFQDLQERGYDETRAALEMVKSGVIRALERGLGINSPSAEYENISQSVTAGVRQGKDDAVLAGEDVGEAAASGVRKAMDDASLAGQQVGEAGANGIFRVGSRRVTTDPAAMERAREQGSSQARANSGPRRATRMGDKEAREQAQAAEEATRATQAQALATEDNVAATRTATDKLNTLNSVIMNGMFALTSLAGVGIMAGGAIGKMSEVVFQFSGVAFALAQVIQLLTQTKLLELISTRKKLVLDALEAATTAGKIVANGGFIVSMTSAAIAVNTFLGPVGWVVLGLTALAGVIALIIGAQQEQQKKVEGLGNAAYLTAEKMKAAGDLLGFEAKTSAFGQNITEGTAAGRGSEESSLITSLREDDNFAEEFSGQIDAIKNASKSEAESVLASVSNQLFAAGASQEQVDAYVRAIAQEAKRTDLSFSFASIDFSKDGAASIVSSAKNAAKTYADVFSKNIKAYYTAEGNLLPDLTVYGKEGLQGVKTFAGSMASALQGLKDGLANNLLSADQFNEGLRGVVGTLNELSPSQLDIALPSLYEKLGIEDLMSEIPSVRDQILLLQADAAGIEIPESDIDALKNSDKSAKAAQVALRVRTSITKKVREQAIEQEALNKKLEEEAFINEKISGANVQMSERIVALQEQRQAYDALIEAGYTAEIAFRLAGDAGLAAGIAAAAGGGLASAAWTDTVNLINQMLEAEKKAPQGGSSGSGTKSAYQQAIEQLQQERKEITNSTIAYNKLRDANINIRTAAEAAEDPILAAALATTKVGTQAWETLVNKIKEVTRLLNKKEIQDLLKTGEINIADRRNQVTVSNALSNLGYSVEEIDEVLSNQELTNNLAQDLKDGVINSEDLLEIIGQIQEMGDLDVQLNFTTKEGAAEEFQKRYDQVVGYLEAQKQTIEIDFQIKTQADSIIVRKAEESIAAIQYKVDDYEAGLTRLEREEDKINETYEERKEALDKVAKANELIARQQKSQLSLAEALSSGDMAAAARAEQEMRAQAASDAISRQGDLLELSKDRALSSLTTTVNGQVMTRAQIEEEIRDLKVEIFNIEENTLEPARERIRLAGVDKEAQLDSLDAQILKWEELSAKVNEAKLKLTPEEMSAMADQAKLIADLLEDWDNIEDKEATLTVIKRTFEEFIAGEKDEDDSEEEKVVLTTETDKKRDDKVTDSKTVNRGTVGDKQLIPTGGSLMGNLGIAAITAAELVRTTKDAVVDLNRAVPNLTGNIRIAEATSAETKKSLLVNPPNKQTKIATGVSLPTLQLPKNSGTSGSGRQPGTLGQWLSDSGNALSNWVAGRNSKADGGAIFGPGTSTSDSIPALLSDGEYVIRASSVSKLGLDFLDFLNSTGKIPGYATGGLIIPDRPSAKRPVAKKNTTAPKPVENIRAAMASDKKSTPQTSKQKQDALYKAGGFQGFEAGLQGMMTDLSKNPVIRAVGKAYSANNLGGQIFRGTVGVLSTPVEIVGAVAKNAVDALGKVLKGDILGAAALSASALPTSVFSGVGNAFAGVVDPTKQKASMFEQAAQSAIDNNILGGKNNPEMAALARLIGGSLNVLGDPLTYVGAGLATRGVKGAAAAGRIPSPSKAMREMLSSKAIGKVKNKDLEFRVKNGFSSNIIEALDPAGNPAGQLTWDATTGEIAMITAFQSGRGVASDMWHYAYSAALREGMTPPVHSSKFTNQGLPWSMRIGGPRVQESVPSSLLDMTPLRALSSPIAEYTKTLFMSKNQIYRYQARKYPHIAEMDLLIKKSKDPDPLVREAAYKIFAEKGMNANFGLLSTKVAGKASKKRLSLLQKLLGKSSRRSEFERYGKLNDPKVKVYPPDPFAVDIDYGYVDLDSVNLDDFVAEGIIGPRVADRFRGQTEYDYRKDPFYNPNEKLAKGGLAVRPKYFNSGGMVSEKQNRDRRYKRGGFQGFEAGFQGLMSDVSSNPIVRAMGNAVSANNPVSAAVRALIGTASLPVELIGSLTKEAIDPRFKIPKKNKDQFGSKLASGVFGFANAIGEGFANSYSGVADSRKQRSSMFEQAAQSAIKKNMFGAKTNPEMAALARIIGGASSIAGDPLTYLGVGVASKSVKAADRLAATKLAEKTLTNPRISITFPREVMQEIITGRFKNQFEMGQPDSLMRRQVEEMLGYPMDTPAINRPIYGAIENKLGLPEGIVKRFPGRTGEFLRLTDPRTNMARMFGGDNPAFAHLDSKGLKGTYTLGDSFVTQHALRLGEYAPQRAREIIEKMKRNPIPYIEAQLNPLINPATGGSGIMSAVREITQMNTKKSFLGTLHPGAQKPIKAKYFNAGGMVKGYSMGGDVVPSMLTPGEFIVSKYGVDNFGVDKLKSINNGTYSGDSVYNYSVNVSVQTDADPDKIARSVMGQIRQLDSQRIRGNSF